MRRSWLIALSLALLLSACGGKDEASLKPSPTSGPVDIETLAHAVVQVQALDNAGDIVWTGSGTIISPDGLILTNAHVVDDREGEYEALGVARTVETDEPPELTYLAEIRAVDYALDLAVIAIVSDLNGDPVTEEFPFVQLGDSEGVKIGDSIRILGYPGIGGETITFTNGVVSGFTSERSVGGRAWIKTDACISDEEAGLADGLYEFMISVEGELQGSRAIFVGGDHPTVELEVENDSSIPICYVFISPSGAQNWGFDHLGIDEGIGPSDFRTFNIPAATYDLLIRDCNENDLIDERGLAITEDSVYTVSD